MSEKTVIAACRTLFTVVYLIPSAGQLYQSTGDPLLWQLLLQPVVCQRRYVKQAVTDSRPNILRYRPKSDFYVLTLSDFPRNCYSDSQPDGRQPCLATRHYSEYIFFSLSPF